MSAPSKHQLVPSESSEAVLTIPGAGALRRARAQQRHQRLQAPVRLPQGQVGIRTQLGEGIQEGIEE